MLVFKKNLNKRLDQVRIMQQVAKIDEFTKQTMDGSLSTQGSTDILTMALGMVEHSGQVRGVGNFITPDSTSTFLDVEIIQFVKRS
ncbi:unnamed protein product [Camellia sinensis]